MNKKVQSVALNSANVRYNNAVDSERVFDIESNVNLQASNVISYDGGVVKKDESQKASFNKYGNNQLSVTFNSASDVMEMCAILNAVNTFIEDVQTSVAESPINI